ncbi:leucyl/phenylalanyl-tRNA--protein transferase [Ponticaulis sp.]|uniref:leucyl/phenylalanyl-tRNA--protein transferase n=1 Tax=Ponticaulis sp. TaxID=2020902 RepID=UPI000B70BDB3|nr:leucyl/phenylalanyl-tRNA--protein transferase [Ponticaulis sp.]MAI92037.1 leucyl/phenylalanyl-tRNA--protein transferase [Ponticaulis sp.]OUX96217.1 MAG: leucyl/phenylalanyl-tRNA--protein transferase [Hyphomonadaceae bacterium TMED5]|tara:strand:- start:5070 stop:5735 length:666 start_codon:yes stop_codon:yes gene_type:complete
MSNQITTDDLLSFYRLGIFPMAEHRNDPDLFLVDPELRGVLPLDRFHIPKKLKKVVRSDPFEIRVDTAFTRVLEGCAASTHDRPSTWINSTIFNLYGQLHRLGYAHSIETWLDGELVGGLYGVSVGGAFFGESMFSRVSEASKVALVHLVARLIYCDYKLLDAQFTNKHLEQFGIIEIPRREFRRRLSHAMGFEADFNAYDGLSSDERSGASAIQRITQTS